MGEHEIMSHFMVKCLFQSWLRLGDGSSCKDWFSPLEPYSAHSKLFHGGRVGLRGAYERASIYTLHVMTHAKTQAEVTNNQRADDGQSNDEDADDTRSFAIADGDRQQLQRHERERHRIAGGKQDDATRSAGGADEVHDSQKHQTGHEQR